MDINLYGSIDQQTAENFSAQLGNFQGEVTIHINSNGGNVFSALTINSLLQKCNATVVIEGLCASAATIVALGAKKICMAKNALFMIHAPSTLLIDYVNAKALEQMKTTLDKIEASIMAIYQQRVPSFQMPENELWLNGTEAKVMGFVDEVFGEAQDVYLDAEQKIIGYNGKYFNMSTCKVFPNNIAPKAQAPAQVLMNKIIMDQMTSGAQNVSGSANVDEKQLRVSALMKAVEGLKK